MSDEVRRDWAIHYGRERMYTTAQLQAAVLAERERYQILRDLVANGVDLFKGSPNGGDMSFHEAQNWVDEQVARRRPKRGDE